MASRRILFSTLITLLLAASVAAPAAADGIVVPDPPPCELGDCPDPFPMRQLAIQNHDVEVEIDGGVAVTSIDQTFRNDNDYPIEGTYIFPLPADAAIGEFRLWIDNEPVPGEVLSKDEARRRYEEIVRRLKDPVLLEYVEGGAFQASVFPIEPGDTRRIQLSYSQVLGRSEDLITYRYPLNTEKFSTQELERVSISVHAHVDGSPGAIYSPSHSVDLAREGEDQFTVSYEAHDILPDRDFILHYSLSDEPVGMSLLSFRDPFSRGEDGTFLLLAAPNLKVRERSPVPKDVILVLDQSGSMDGAKFDQAQEAARYVLENLNEDDRFGLLAFSSSTQVFRRELAGTGEIEEGVRWIGSLAAKGATDINRALLEALALAGQERPTYLLFLTDGLPTEGVTDSRRILANIGEAAPAWIRLFAFGVGYDVDTFLLDSLAQEHSGTSTYVTPDQQIDEAISGLYTKLDAPVLTDLELSFDGAVVHDLQPEELPDLFEGSQLVVLGRYKEPGEVTVNLSGQGVDGALSFEYGPFKLRSEGGGEYLPRLWATRKVGSLLREIRLHGPEEELVQQVVALSIRYGIVTPYTSYLVTEPKSVTQEGQRELVGEVLEEMSAPQEVAGQEAVERAAAEADIAEAEGVGRLEAEAADLVRWVGDRTYRLTDDVWIDTAFDPSTGTPVQVQYLSEAYFALAHRSDQLAAAFALGPRVIALVGNQAYEVVEGEGATSPDSLPAPAPEATEGDSGDVQPPTTAPSGDGGPSRTDRSQGRPCLGLYPAFLLMGSGLIFWRRRWKAKGSVLT